MPHVIPLNWNFGWLCLIELAFEAPYRLLYSLSTYSRTVIPITSSLLALLAHRAYYVPAHCGVTCCGCFVLLLPLPSIVAGHVLLLGFTTWHHYIFISLRCFIHFSFVIFITCMNTLVNAYFVCTSQGVQYTSRVWLLPAEELTLAPRHLTWEACFSQRVHELSLDSLIIPYLGTRFFKLHFE